MLSEGRQETSRFYTDTDVLLRIRNDADARVWVDRVWALATPHEREQVVRAFFLDRITPEKKTQTRKGGGIRDVLDYRVYKLLEIADVSHDFGFRYAKPLLEDGDVRLPNGMNYEHFVTTSVFVETVTKKPWFTFKSAATLEQVKNPMYRVHLTSGFDIVAAHERHPEHTIEELFEDQQRYSIRTEKEGRVVSVDVWTVLVDSGEEDGNARRKRPVLKLIQVAQLVANMRRIFGGKQEMVIDASDDALTSLMIGAKFISRDLFKRFTLDPYVMNRNDLTKRMESLIASHVGHHTPITWEPSITDANLFDPANNGLVLPIDTRPTGCVFRTECGFQVELLGIANNGGREVNVKVRTMSGQEHAFAVSNKDTTMNVSKNAIIQRTWANEPSVLNNVLDQLTNIEQYALKRAGDWGQVENCVRYGKVFVTSDQIAALYAAYRGVPFVFVRQEENLRDEVPNLPEFYRHTFILSP